MAQATFSFDASTPMPGAAGSAAAVAPAHRADIASAGRSGGGFEIGWDFAHYRLTPPVAHLHADNPVRQGWSAARAVFGTRTLRPTRWARQWLQLRLQAWQHGQAFEGVQVTPHFLAQLQSAECPVTRQPLPAQPIDRAEDEGAGRIVRLNPRAAWAAGNLVMVSAAVAQAQGEAGWAEALANARRIEAGECAQINGLGAAAWARLACLASLCTPLDHATAATLPLLVLPPNRLRVINPVQALQVMLTLQFCEAGYARRLVSLAVLMPSTEARHAFQVFMHTLLARRLAAGPVLDAAAAREAMEAAWADALVQRRWQRLAQRLTAADAEQLLQRAARRGLMGSGQQWRDVASATEGWALERAGQAPTLASSEGVVSANGLLSH
ncbi:hypothetical protein [Aquabacterium sp.]|uniref:hypothetical protein n=1 Tax=Aquabacterium sp. TaxID=1872578 RepID=UPI003784E2DB